MAQLRSDLLIRLTDRASGPARGILGLMNRLRSAGASAGGGLAAVGDRATRSIGALHIKLIAATAAAYGLQRAMAGVVRPAASFESKLLDIAQKADLSESGIAVLGSRVRKMSVELGRSAGELGEAVDTMLGFGLAPEQTMKALPAIIKTATAYEAKVNDLASAAYFTINNLKVPAEELGQALETMASAGKSGGFELKDMAAEFPALTAAAQGLGMNGVNAVAKLTAALQIARDGASSGSEAATNTANLLQKIQSSDAVNKWKKFGVDIRKEVQKTQKAGGDLFEMVAQKASKVLKGDLGKLGDLYQDAEVQKFLRPLIQGLDRYREIRDKAFSARGGIEKDYQDRLKTFNGQVRRLSASFEELRMRVGERLLGPLTRFVSAFGDRLTNIDKSVNIFDKLGAAIRGLSVGILGVGSDGGLADAFGKLADLIFGRSDDLASDTEQMAQSFERFRQMGASLREFAASVGAFVTRFQELTGLDLSSLAKWGLTLGAAALGVSLFAKAVRGLASAVALLTGMKALWGGAKWIGSLTGLAGVAGGAGTGAAAGAAGAAAGAVAGGGRKALSAAAKKAASASAFADYYANKQLTGYAAKFVPSAAMAIPWARLGSMAKWAAGGVAGAYALPAGMDAIDTVSDAWKKTRDETGRYGMHSLPQDRVEGNQKLSDQRARLAEIEAQLAALRSKSRDPETFAFANQSLISTAEELRASIKNLVQDMLGRQMPVDQGKMSIESLAEKIQPKGTQDVRITNPPPAPNVPVSVSVTVHATTNASAADIGAAVGKQVGAQTKRALEGAFSDAAN